MISTEVLVSTHERLRGNNGKRFRNSRNSCIYFQNEFQHANEFSEVVIFKCSSVLLIVWFRQKSMFSHTSGCPETTANARKAEESQFSTKWVLSCKWVFWGVAFSNVLVFSKTHDLNRSPCFNVQAVAPMQREMFDELKKISFSRNEIYHANELSEVLI